MSTDYGALINTLVNNNQQFIQRLMDINSELDAYLEGGGTSPKVLSSFATEAEVVNKKIKDNLATINNLAYKTQTPSSFFDDVQAVFNKKVRYVSDTLPTTFVKGDTVAGSVIFSNEGMFYSWTADKNIILRIKISDFDDNVIQQQTYAFNPSSPSSNAPGDTSVNGDFQKQKTFTITNFVIPQASGQYYMYFDVMDDSYTFLDGMKKYVTIV